MTSKYRRSILLVTSCLLFYTLAGFFLLPWFLQRYLTHSLANNLQHTIEVQDVHFNPFLLYLQIDGLKILDVDTAPLVSLEQFRFDYEFLAVFRLEYGIQEFTLEKPYVKIEADGQGSYTLLHMFSAKPDSRPEEVPPAANDPVSSIPAVWLEKFQINGGSIDYFDAARAGGFQQHIDLPNLAIDDFYTLKSEHANHISVEVRDIDGGLLRLDTTVNSIQPLHVAGQLDVENFNLAPVWKWLMLPVNFYLQVPRFELATKFDLQVQDTTDLQVSGGSLTLRDLALSNNNTPDVQVIKLPLLSVNDVQMNLQQQSVVIGAVQATDGLLDVILDKQGAVNLQTLFAPAEVLPATATPPAEPAKPWDVLIHQVEVSNYTVQLRDEKPKKPFAITLSPLSIAINEWKPLSADKFAIQLKTGINGENIQVPGNLTVDTQLQVTPLLADVHLDLQQFPLLLVQPYVGDIVRATINNGALNALMDVHFEAGDKPKLDVKGSTKIQKLSILEQGRERNLVSWDAMDLSGLSYQLQDNTLKIDKIALNRLNSGVIINADGTINAKTLMLPQPETKKTSSAPMKMNIAVIAIDNADLAFSDLSMKPNFKVAMQKMSGSIKGLSSDAKSNAVIDLKGKVDRYAPVTINGKVNPLAAKPSLDMHMAFSNLELTTFTPYSGTYAGFNIERGQLSLDIDYKLVDDKIEGKNKIVMDQLQLGSPVESAKAVDLPLRLAIALLKDENGVIDLGFEVGGDLNDPQFSIGGILWKVLSNMIMKVVTSPFNALSALAGGADTEGIDQIAFAPGHDELDEASLKKLQTASAMLNKRDSLHVNVQGNTLPDEDRKGIQSQKLIAILSENREIQPETFLSSKSAVENGDAYKAMEHYYDKKSKEDL
ncbi:MAG TPA: DUF748 domain-containing protein, partial [Pseudomonadales bacterium]|nr:DUF748 domain-containing protein [Pseudomonadales bacterium]